MAHLQCNVQHVCYKQAILLAANHQWNHYAELCLLICLMTSSSVGETSEVYTATIYHRIWSLARLLNFLKNKFFGNSFFKLLLLNYKLYWIIIINTIALYRTIILDFPHSTVYVHNVYNINKYQWFLLCFVSKICFQAPQMSWIV